MSFTSVLLPEPLTPVTQVKRPSGKPTVTFLRLFSRALITRTQPFAGCSRTLGTRIEREPLRNWPVSERSFAITSATVPAATICPPREPACGPRSTR